MKRIVYLIPVAALAAIAVSCNDRFVPEVADIEAREPATKVYAPDMQQNRIFDAIDATLSNLGDFSSIAEAAGEISQIPHLIKGWNWEDMDSKAFIEDIISRFNSMSTLSGGAYSSLYELSKFKGDYVVNKDGIFRKDYNKGIKVNIGDEFYVDAVFSSAEKEYKIGEVDSLPVKYTFTELKSVEINGGAYKAVSFKKSDERSDSVTYEKSNLTVKLPKSIAVSLYRKEKSNELLNLTISIDANYNGEFIASYLGTFDIKKILDEVSLDLGLTASIGGYGLNINRLSYGSGNAEFDFAISKNRTNVIVVKVGAKGVKPRKSIPADNVFIADEVAIADKAFAVGRIDIDSLAIRTRASITDGTSFRAALPVAPGNLMNLIAIIMKAMTADELDAYVNLAGMLQIKASATNLDDLLARLDSVRNNVTFMQTILRSASPREPRPFPDSCVVRYSARIDSIPAIIVRDSPADTAAIEKLIEDFGKNVSCKFYFGSDIMQSELVVFKAGYFSGAYAINPGLKFAGVDTPVSLGALFTGKSTIGLYLFDYDLSHMEGDEENEEEFAEAYPDEFYLNYKVYQTGMQDKLMRHASDVQMKWQSTLDKIFHR